MATEEERERVRRLFSLALRTSRRAPAGQPASISALDGLYFMPAPGSGMAASSWTMQLASIEPTLGSSASFLIWDDFALVWKACTKEDMGRVMSSMLLSAATCSAGDLPLLFLASPTARSVRMTR